MKIAIIGANGKQGSKLLKEAMDRKHEVTAIIRKEHEGLVASNVLVKDLFELTAADLSGFDAVISAFAAWEEKDLPKHKTSLEHLANILAGTDTRLLVVGGAGTLYVNPEHTLKLMDGPDFPDAYKPVASAMGAGLDYIRTRNDVKWTYLSPAAEFDAEGAKTGTYQLSGEEFTLNAEGKSYISYADYAVAMIDEVENGNYIGKRFSVLAK